MGMSLEGNKSLESLSHAMGRTDLTPGPTMQGAEPQQPSAKRQLQMAETQQAGAASPFSHSDDTPGVTPGGVPQPHYMGLGI
jgi:hypothetical protein